VDGLADSVCIREIIGLESICVLLIEDNPGDARLVQEILKDVSDVEVSVEWVNELNKGIDLSIAQAFDVLFVGPESSSQQGAGDFHEGEGSAPFNPDPFDYGAR
jgi:hypothetical protein